MFDSMNFERFTAIRVPLLKERTMAANDKDQTEGRSNKPEKRPGPFAQDTSREPPSKEQREKDYDGKISQVGGEKTIK
jgi:hypothetical protein